ncbi:MAG: DUF2628 domain-containing protein [Gammaproteobacteria bacterium]|nr:DUF2628 domain-containing protein [Gammaproteobacteria bacterium]
MPGEEKYLVVLSGRVLPERAREEVLDNLAELFHVPREKVEPLLRGRRAPLAKQYERARAEEVRDAIREAGAQCEIEEVAEEVAPAADAHEHVHEQEREAHARESAPKQKPGGTRGGIPDEVALMRVVAVNTDYYRKQFAKFVAADRMRAKFALTWHWPAFFAFFFWAVYRRMWLPAAVNLAGGLALLHFAGWAHPLWMSLAWAFVWPLCANYLYFRHACALAPNATGEKSGGEHRFGVSRLGLLGGVLFLFFLSFTLGERIGLQSALHKYEALDPQARTALVLRGTLFMVLTKTPRGEALDRAALLGAARRVIEERNVRDGWDNEIEARMDADGRIALVSAGADGYFDTEDDITHSADFFGK